MQAGYPAAPLQLSDELNLTLMQKIRKESADAAKAEGKELPADPAGEVINTLVEKFDRKGKLGGAGFYDYAEGKRTGLWSGLRENFNSGTSDAPIQDLIDRMLFIEAIETQKCFDENVLITTADATSAPSWASDSRPGPVAFTSSSSVMRAARLASSLAQRNSLRSTARGSPRRLR